MDERQFGLFAKQLKNVSENSPFYRQKFAEGGFDPRDVKGPEDIKKIPFTDKGDLRAAYPLGLQAVREEDVVRIHSTSGTTGEPVIIPYTRQDVEDWCEMFRRCYEIAGVTNLDRVQITPGFGLWTAGIGFEAGCEALGAMAIPMGPGNTEKQLKMMTDLKTTVLGSTSSYALLLAEQVEKMGLKDKIALKKGIIGSERWSDKMRKRIREGLGIELFDIYGLTEIYGPGISIDCECHQGLHYFDDFLYMEIIDPDTGENVPDGQYGEIVITTLKKEGAPLLRYRTHDMSRIIPGKCACGRSYPRHDRILGRTDDVVKVKGVNIHPSQIDMLLKGIDKVSSEYMVTLDKVGSADRMVLQFEVENGADLCETGEAVAREFKKRIGIKIDTQAVEIGGLPRSEKKTKRIHDLRYQ
ncbi:MAG: phenylacetate--CoA ligase [Christensenella sp.]|uniref:phenylacetate--CoA ligase family protein n=1 Tax=Christensenella sp. TaxID=1935934 RepID=UPI002B1F6BBC|nr:phenylacetate--CoA ligase [Christensenella sp.]MEA5004204.1 phenylacetate--CoA ligase [Christensenella sp.]